ncbi:CWF19-like protein 2 isoform X2 [Tamandua tetradactyla]|uniref:CWF19-like protein 2 isoform X2 n=1 Tax=Tamandua tetradactyla TaxID=48850 RepID=UPI004053EF9B
MAAASGRFESERRIEERKEQTRIARAEVLRQAKANFEKEERCKELKRLRGEDTWMLPDVNERIEQFSQEHSVKKKKKKDKHSKKLKKEKKKKSKKQKYENESVDSSSSSEDEWVEAVPSQAPSKEKAWKVQDEKSEKEDSDQIVQRDEWMTVDFMSVKTVSLLSLKADKETLRKIEQEKTQTAEQSRLLERELNPYWKDGGTGLPPEDCKVSSVSKVSVVEDGGLSWLRKSYQRMKEQADKQNRNFEDIVAERYGSMEIFQSKLEEAEKTASKKEDYRQERWRKSTYSDKAQNSQDNRKSDFLSYNKCSKDRYSATDITNDINKDKFIGDEKGNRSGSLETRSESNLRQNQEFSSLRNLRSQFLRPSDDEEMSFLSKGRDFEPSSSSASVSQGSLSCGFQKPSKNSKGSLSSWSQSDRREGDKRHSNQKPLETSSGKDCRNIPEHVRGKSQDESLRDDSLKKEHLQDTKSSFSGSSEDESIHILSVDEKNKLGAKIIKAEMMGNMKLAEQLKAQLEKANKFKEITTQILSRKSGKEKEDHQEVILVKTDQSGRVWPVNTPGKSVESKVERQRRQMVPTHEEKERVRYFYDDAKLSLNDLVKNEKMGTAEDQNRLFMRMASKFMGKTDRDYYTLDDMFVSKAADREGLGEDMNQRKRAIAEHQSLTAQMEKCLYCFDSSQFPKHLIVAIGIKVYLCLPNFQSLTEGHCLIVPLQHYRAATLLDEDIWEEIQVPRGLPYFSVDFGLQGGFAHVIEDQHKFPAYFGKEIIGGMLDIEPRLWRKGIRESFEDQRKKALQFAQWWKPYDFTKSKKC